MAKKSATPETGTWSIFQQGGGSGSAVTWADDALREIGAPINPGNEQLIYDWEVSEGGGGWFNPLNEGPDPSHPGNSGGSQYGGGAANYTSYTTGLLGFKDYLSMPNYTAIKNDLKANDPTQARQDIINSPWAASHYNAGSSFSDSPLPGKKNALKGGATYQDATLTSISSSLSGLGSLAGNLDSADFWERGALIVFGGVLILVGIIILALPAASRTVDTVGSTSRDIQAAQKAVSGFSGGGPTSEEREDRSRRLALAEKNTDIGAEKVRIQGMREARLARPKHTGNREPNPSPAHS